MSPNYPHNYPNYMHCECYLQTYLDASVVFRVLDFDIEQGQSCTYDYLQVPFEIFDGGSFLGSSLFQ